MIRAILQSPRYSQEYKPMATIAENIAIISAELAVLGLMDNACDPISKGE
jgi:hypothetical protein